MTNFNTKPRLLYFWVASAQRLSSSALPASFLLRPSPPLSLLPSSPKTSSGSNFFGGFQSDWPPPPPARFMPRDIEAPACDAGFVEVVAPALGARRVARSLT